MTYTDGFARLGWQEGRRAGRQAARPNCHPSVQQTQVNDPEFESRFLDRSGLLTRVRTELALVALTTESMQDEQGRPPAARASFEGGPVTDLGSQLLKLLAARYADHPDYRADWRPAVELPMP